MSDVPPPEGKLRTVITYLEMTEPPRHKSVTPAAHKLAFMRADEPTVSFYRYLYDTVGGPWLWYERRVLDDEALREIIQSPDADLYILYVGGVPAGFSELDRRDPEEIQLAYFGLIPEFIGRALGPFLLERTIEEAWVHNPTRLKVNTCTLDHPKALAVYQRAGFTVYGQETKEFDDPRLTGVMPPDTGPQG